MGNRLPEHRNPTKPDRTATAPYNFVPLPEVVVTAVEKADELPGHDRYCPNRHTGFFDVTLTTCSPLYIRCPLTLEDFLRGEDKDEQEELPFRERVKNRPEFFYTRDPAEPVIPGSSLRGMLRNLLEIVSYGKVQWVTDRKLFFRSLDDSSIGRKYRRRMVGHVQAGFLRQQGDCCFIQVCEMIRVPRRMLGERIYDDNGLPSWRGSPRQHQPVWVKDRNGKCQKIQFKRPMDPGWREGRLVITGDVRNKKKEFIFLLPSPDARNIKVDQAMLQRFHDEDQITQWQERAFPTDMPEKGCRERPGMLRRERFLRTEGDPVFFLEEGGHPTFLGRAQMFRLPYDNRPLDLVPEGLRSAADIDYAEAIFGFVRDGRELEEIERLTGRRPKQGDPERAYAGRVSVTDGVLEPGQSDVWLSDEPVVPHILASPKPTAFQHYLTQKSPDEQRKLCHYDSASPEETVIRGHKLYWHRNDIGLEQDGKVADQHTLMRPVRAGVRFRFRVHFENLTDKELGALCWVLHPGGGHGQEYRHKLGMGKPLGMGAVRLESRLHLIDRKLRYRTLFDGARWHTGEGATVEDLSDPDVLKQRVSPFEEHVLDVLGKHRPGGYRNLREVPRIKMLLAMLSWPGPSGDSTAYMELEGFKSRPVLPDPLHVLALSNSGVTGPPQNPGQAETAPAPPGRDKAAPEALRGPWRETWRQTGATIPVASEKGLAGRGSRKTREQVTLLAKLSPGKFRVRTDRGEEAECTHVPLYPEPQIGGRCMADVFREDGGAVRAVFKGWR